MYSKGQATDNGVHVTENPPDTESSDGAGQQMKITHSVEIDNVAEVVHLVERLDKARGGFILLLVGLVLVVGLMLAAFWVLKH